jgi:hypothetical protein
MKKEIRKGIGNEDWKERKKQRNARIDTKQINKERSYGGRITTEHTIKISVRDTVCQDVK